MNLEIAVTVPKKEVIDALENLLSDIIYHISDLGSIITYSNLGTKKSFFGKTKSLQDATLETSDFLKRYTNYPELKRQTEFKLRLLKHLGDDITSVTVPIEFLETLQLYKA